jgi:hypothetical protein
VSLEEIPRGARVFLEPSIFLNHFLGASLECRGLLERCERAEVRGLTSALALCVVAERLLALEESAAPSQDGVERGRARAEGPKPSHLHDEAVSRIPLMGVDVLPLDLRAVLRGGTLRRQHPVGARLSLDLAVAREAGVDLLATAEPGRGDIEGFRLFRAADVVA